MTGVSLRKLVGILGFAVVSASAPLAAAEAPPISKDVGPASASCDGRGKGTEAWKACVGTASAAMSDTELFYAGYWLAKSGAYAEALRYLKLAKSPDARVLTYIGFATRKLGDVEAALPLYARALALDPDYSVARAYLGEAYLTKGEPEKAKGELAEIETRCGRTCPEYADLAGHIARYNAGARRSG